MKRLVLIAVLIALTPALPAVGAQPDLTYPVLSPLDNFGGPTQDGQNAALGTYAFQSGFANVPTRLVSRIGTLAAAGPAALVQAAIDGATHQRTTLLGVNIGGTGNPAFMPDWNNDGIFGNAPDYDVDNSDQLVSAPFRYPCIGLDGKVTYETTSGTCSLTGTFKLGEARRGHIVNSRGLVLAATLWLPSGALVTTAPVRPAVVFAGGFGSRQADYYAYPMSAVRAGFIALGYDPAGQGDSEGTGFDLSSMGSQPTGDCAVPGACRDLQDMVRWLIGADVVPSPIPSSAMPRLTPRRSPVYAPAGNNVRNPALAKIDATKVGIFGQSMGSLSTIGYLQARAHNEQDAAGKPLPAVSSAVAISGSTPLDRIDVPLQLQTTDYDIPGYNEANGSINATDGPIGNKAWYDGHRSRRLGSGALTNLIFESGNHLDTTNAPYVPRAVWVLGLSAAYAIDHHQCYLQGDAAACARAVSKRPNLSRIVASEYDADGPSGPGPSRCISIPDKAALVLAYHPDALLAALQGNPPYDCVT